MNMFPLLIFGDERNVRETQKNVHQDFLRNLEMKETNQIAVRNASGYGNCTQLLLPGHCRTEPHICQLQRGSKIRQMNSRPANTQIFAWMGTRQVSGRPL